MDRIYLGIDGGCTKTVGLLLDDEGRAIASHRAGRCALFGPLKDHEREFLRSVVDELCSQAGVARERIVQASLGLNGVDFEDEFDEQYAAVVEAVGLPGESVALVNDGIVALWAATSAPAAVILQHGTGFTGAFRSSHGDEQTFDHLGVGRTFDMRWELPTLIARMLDGRFDPTPLKQAVLAHFGIADEGRYGEILFRQQIPGELLTTTPPIIFDAWRCGDKAAAWLVERALDDYALAAGAMIARTGSDSPDVALGGGVIAQAPHEFWDALAERVRSDCPGASITQPKMPPEYGACIMAGFRDGREPQEFFEQVRTQRQS